MEMYRSVYQPEKAALVIFFLSMYLQERFLRDCIHIFSFPNGRSFCARLQTVSDRAVCHPPDPAAPRGTAQCSCPRPCNTSASLLPVATSTTLAVRAGDVPVAHSPRVPPAGPDPGRDVPVGISSPRSRRLAVLGPPGSSSTEGSTFRSPERVHLSDFQARRALPAPTGAAGTGFFPPKPTCPAPQPRTALGTSPGAGRRAHPGG